jgi:hypothetical protein
MSADTATLRSTATTEDAGDNSRGGRSITFLLTATVLLLFANGRHTIPIAAWLAPLVLLRFVRATRPGRGLLVAWLVLSATWAFQFRGMAPLPGVWY